MFGTLFQEIFYRPIFNILIGMVNVIPGHDIGIAIILLTVLVKAALWPMSASMIKQQKALAELQPKVDELKKKYSDPKDKEELGRQLIDLYKVNKVNPAASCGPLLIQLPVFIALYRSLSQGLKSEGFNLLYWFVHNPGTIDPKLFGWLDLSQPSHVLAVASGVAQFFQARMMVSKTQPKKVPGAQDEAMLATMNKQMTYTMPILTVFIAWKLPGGLGLYWFVMTMLTILQQYYTMRKKKVSAAAVVETKA
jgi:YidC/Oxa1 family membrane protein insertase